MNIKVGFVSLGCPKNLMNTERMLALLAAEGFEIVAEDVEADVMVINTCAFIESAKTEAIDSILDIAWLKEHHTLKGIVVAGCLPQRYGDEILKELPEVNCIIGTGSVEKICEAVRAAYHGTSYRAFDDIDTAPFGGERVVTTPEHYAFIKIAEGCDNRCSYCIIPYLRGKFRSRQMDDVLYEARMLAESGVKELIVVAQDTSRYGTDLPGHKRLLPELIRQLAKIEKLHWIRLHYLYPDEIDDELIDVIAAEPKVVKYLDIPIQHCNSKVLKLMNRRGDHDFLCQLFHKLRSRIPGLVIRTSVITGLPGEGEEEFTQLCEFLKEQKLERTGAFAFSPEEGTPAAEMEFVDNEIARNRAEMIETIQSRIMDDYNASFIGKTLEVLVDGYDEENEQFYGRPYADCPDIDGRVWIASEEALVEGSFVWVTIDGVIDGDLSGYIVEE